jgi:hypothetical protein
MEFESTPALKKRNAWSAGGAPRLPRLVATRHTVSSGRSYRIAWIAGRSESAQADACER